MGNKITLPGTPPGPSGLEQHLQETGSRSALAFQDWMDAGAPEERETPWDVTFPKPHESGPGGHMVDIVSSGAELLSLSNLTRAGVETAGTSFLAGKMLVWLGRYAWAKPHLPSKTKGSSESVIDMADEEFDKFLREITERASKEADASIAARQASRKPTKIDEFDTSAVIRDIDMEELGELVKKIRKAAYEGATPAEKIKHKIIEWIAKNDVDVPRIWQHVKPHVTGQVLSEWQQDAYRWASDENRSWNKDWSLEELDDYRARTSTLDDRQPKP